MSPRAYALWEALDSLIQLCSGIHDNMTPGDIGRFLRDVGAAGLSDLHGIDDSTLQKALLQGGFTKHHTFAQYASIYVEPSKPSTNVSYAVLGQRYNVDRDVLSAVTDDRVPGRRHANALDVAFGALGNNAALAPLTEAEPGLPQSGALAQIRQLSDS